MINPFERLKHLPWLSLLQVAAIVTAFASVLEFIIALSATQFAPIQSSLRLLYSPPLGIILPLLTAAGVGALSVYILERFFREVYIDRSSLWALVPCFVLTVLLKSLLPLPSFLVGFSQPEIVSIIVGIFWKGRPYWR
ncbi:peptide chain release factor 1 [Ancylothrix sp. C2]|uniref:peptide chain release factor 1 n=1 Tax=Ancylothrix sp. D3o TaxID=2953691 RepID=UPI0021BA3FD7|nr:peptide chain release factor 1 [Ancylothrix sp. D3o]MCT7951909.1 peptide chain release factor 1 [Ancylothrix sp. D3o]